MIKCVCMCVPIYNNIYICISVLHCITNCLYILLETYSYLYIISFVLLYLSLAQVLIKRDSKNNSLVILSKVSKKKVVTKNNVFNKYIISIG